MYIFYWKDVVMVWGRGIALVFVRQHIFMLSSTRAYRGPIFLDSHLTTRVTPTDHAEQLVVSIYLQDFIGVYKLTDRKSMNTFLFSF